MSVLRVLTFCLSAVALAIASPADIEKRAPLQQSVYDQIVYHFKYASSAYANSCGHPNGQHLVKTFSNKATDTQGYIARDDVKKEFIVAFRGSTDCTDAKTEKNSKLVKLAGPGYFKFGGDYPPLVHKGFLAAHNSVAQNIQDTLKAQLEANNGSHAHYAIISVGHDIGGSLAALAGVAFRYVFFDNLVQTYTFGQPRTGDINWAYLVDELMGYLTYRVVHTNDGVPKLIPGDVKGYVHHPVEYWNYRDPPSANTTKQCRDTGDSLLGEDEKCSISVKTHTVNAAHFKYFNIPYNKAYCSAK
ncbi:alpha/beta-hydrolase [Exidia glandulosa HHB12029]|uniref:Alpha/beta-hydrolase n=1 Tax=Exidia glandulosa HHB12029 TaxID=1314781 RepID=A0A165QG82_EXIGL|nr:alpha/beta-hydrolase [Exidia glandulosa HHB12029]